MKKCILALSLLFSCAAQADMSVDIQANLDGREVQKTVIFNAETPVHSVVDNGVEYSLTALEQEVDAYFTLNVINVDTKEVITCPVIQAEFGQKTVVTVGTDDNFITISLVPQRIENETNKYNDISETAAETN